MEKIVKKQGVAGSVAQKKRKLLDPGKKVFLAMMPFAILYFLLCYKPLWGWSYAFFDYKPGYKLADCDFVGLKHFTTMFSNRVTRRETFRVLQNTFAMSFIGLITNFVPMLFAVFFNELPGKRAKKVIQTLVTVPHFVSWVIVYSLVLAMFAPEAGAINNVLKSLGIIEESLNIIANSDHVWLTMYLYGLWKGLGWGSIVYLAAISSVDQELYEAATVDGARRFQKMRYITIPSLMPTFLTLTLMEIGHFLSTGMEKYYVFQNAFNKSRIEVLDLYVYNLGFGGGDISFATAVGIMKSIVGLVLLFGLTLFLISIISQNIAYIQK